MKHSLRLSLLAASYMLSSTASFAASESKEPCSGLGRGLDEAGPAGVAAGVAAPAPVQEQQAPQLFSDGRFQKTPLKLMHSLFTGNIQVLPTTQSFAFTASPISVLTRLVRSETLPAYGAEYKAQLAEEFMGVMTTPDADLNSRLLGLVTVAQIPPLAAAFGFSLFTREQIDTATKSVLEIFRSGQLQATELSFGSLVASNTLLAKQSTPGFLNDGETDALTAIFDAQFAKINEYINPRADLIEWLAPSLSQWNQKKLQDLLLETLKDPTQPITTRDIPHLVNHVTHIVENGLNNPTYYPLGRDRFFNAFAERLLSPGIRNSKAAVDAAAIIINKVNLRVSIKSLVTTATDIAWAILRENAGLAPAEEDRDGLEIRNHAKATLKDLYAKLDALDKPAEEATTEAPAAAAPTPATEDVPAPAAESTDVSAATAVALETVQEEGIDEDLPPLVPDETTTATDVVAAYDATTATDSAPAVASVQTFVERAPEGDAHQQGPVDYVV